MCEKGEMWLAPVTQGCLAGLIVGYWTGEDDEEDVEAEAEGRDIGEVLEALSRSSVDWE